MKKKEKVKILFDHKKDGRISTTVEHRHKDGSVSFSLYPPQDCTIEEMWLTILAELFPKVTFEVEEEYLDDDEDEDYE